MPISASAQRNSDLTALLVMHLNEEPVLCPFFGKCEGVLVVDPHSGCQSFYANTERTPDAACALVLKTGARRLISGFINDLAAEKLRGAGIDVRLGSCGCSISDLVACFPDLPRA